MRCVWEFKRFSNLSCNGKAIPNQIQIDPNFKTQEAGLLQAGVEPNKATLDTSETAAHLAARNGHLEVLRLLLEYGADKEAG